MYRFAMCMYLVSLYAYTFPINPSKSVIVDKDMENIPFLFWSHCYSKILIMCYWKPQNSHLQSQIYIELYKTLQQ